MTDPYARAYQQITTEEDGPLLTIAPAILFTVAGGFQLALLTLFRMVQSLHLMLDATSIVRYAIGTRPCTYNPRLLVYQREETDDTKDIGGLVCYYYTEVGLRADACI